MQQQERVRNPGKTKRNRDNGAATRNAANKAERAAYDRDGSAKASSFPWHTCNGKRTQALRRASKKR